MAASFESSVWFRDDTFWSMVSMTVWMFLDSFQCMLKMTDSSATMTSAWMPDHPKEYLDQVESPA